MNHILQAPAHNYAYDVRQALYMHGVSKDPNSCAECAPCTVHACRFEEVRICTMWILSLRLKVARASACQF